MERKHFFLGILMVCFGYGFTQETITELAELPNEISETSGLIFFDNLLWTHNDSGNEAQLFAIDTLDFQINRTLGISNANNIDWEDIAQDQNYVYIGDFGNNSGTRTDLTILKISKSEMAQNTSVNAEKIYFTYEDQTSFEPNNKTDFDAEALITFGDNLVVLTKQWTSKMVKAYLIPKEPGTYVGTSIGEYDVQGLVTGATYDSEKSELLLVGYSEFLTPFWVKVEGVTNADIFGGQVIKTDFSMGMAQMEGIAKVDAQRYFISSEKFSNMQLGIDLKPKAFALQFQTEEEPTDPIDPTDPTDPTNPTDPGPDDLEPTDSTEKLVVFKSDGSSLLHFEHQLELPFFNVAIFDVSGRKMLQTQWNSASYDLRGIDISTLEQAVYYFVLYTNEGVFVTPFIKN